MQQTNRSRHRHITSFQVISLGFLSVILLGSLLLMLPIATKSGQCTSFLDALFTATSAVCVTGLVVNDTATYWSLFGQGVILLLIQIGGMGIITIAIAIAVVSGRVLEYFYSVWNLNERLTARLNSRKNCRNRCNIGSCCLMTISPRKISSSRSWWRPRWIRWPWRRWKTSW